MLVEEAAEAARYLHTYYLVEAECSGTSLSVHCDGPNTGKSNSGRSAFEREPQLGIGARTITALESANESHKCVAGGTFVPGKRSHPMRSLAFPSSCLPATSKLLLQQYPCLRSPVVVARMLQGCGMSIVSAKTSSGASGIPQELHEDCCDSATAVSCVPSSSASLLKGVGIGQTHQAESTSGYEAFGSSICLHFRGLKDLAAQLCGVGSSVGGLRGNEPGDQGLNWKDVGGRIAVTEVGGAAVEAGIAPWEAAEIFADIFKTSILG